MTAETVRDPTRQEEPVPRPAPEMEALAERIEAEWRAAFLKLTTTGELEPGFVEHLESHPADQRVVDEALAIEEARLQGLVGLARPETQAPSARHRLMAAVPTRAIVGELVQRMVHSFRKKEPLKGD